MTRDTLYEVYTGSEAQDGVASGSNSSDDGNDVDKNDDGNRELADIFRSRFDYQYPYELSTHLPGKFSVSELKHRDIDESQDEAVHIVQSERKKPVPEADGDTKKNMGAERGNAYHKVFELLDYNVNPDEDSVREFIHGLVLSGRMDAEYEKLVRAGNANYLWISYFYAYLNEKGRAGFVMASSATDSQGSDKDIREKLVKTGHVDVMISVGNNFFYTKSLPCSLWFFDKGKKEELKNKVLFIDEPCKTHTTKVTPTIVRMETGRSITTIRGTNKVLFIIIILNTS